MIRLSAVLLACALAVPAAAVEFCTQPPSGSNDRACNGALAEGFGGVLAYEHETAPDAHLGAWIQWIGADFAADGPPLLVAHSETGPMWRPRALLLDPDTALVVWTDGRNRTAPDAYSGFDLRGTIVRRGQGEPAGDFVLARGSETHGIMDPDLLYDPVSNLVVIEAGRNGSPEGAADPTLLAFDRAELLAMGETFTLPAPRFAVPNSVWGAIAFDPQRRLLQAQAGAIDVRVTALWTPPDTPPARDMVARLEPRWHYGESGRWAWITHRDLAIGPDGQTAVVVAVVRDRMPVTYLAFLFGAEGSVVRRMEYQGPVLRDWNLHRPKVAFSGDEPVLFLPVPDAKDPAANPALFVAPLVDGVLTQNEGDMYPMPGKLEQFDIVLVDHGANGKAALVASHGEAPARICVWPSELIGY